MRSNFKLYSVTDGENTFVSLEKAYRSFYKNDEEKIEIADTRGKSKRDTFYTIIKEDIHKFISKDGLSASRYWDFFHEKNTAKRNFDEKRINLIFNLIVHYEDYIFIKYDEDGKAVYKEKESHDISNQPETEIEQNLPANEITFDKKDISNRFSTIRIGIVDFEIKIEDLVDINLIKGDEEYSKQNNDTTSDNSYSLISLIQEQNDIFIKAPAGYGKSTLLQSTYHKIANNQYDFSNNDIPIYIELKGYTKNKSLLELIKEDCNFFNQIKPENHDFNIILLIDGIDEFTGDISVLLSEIQQLKKEYKVQIIATGRHEIPFENRGIYPKMYSIEKLSSQKIHQLFGKILPKNKDASFKLLLNNELSGQLSIPLYLTLLLNYFKKKQTTTTDISFLKNILINKGKLMEEIIVNQFVLEYEHKRSESDHFDSLNKNNQINIITFIAYHLTFNCDNKEVEDKLEIVKALTQEFSQLNIDFTELLNQFVLHNILKQTGSDIGFEKVELRFFFTARYIKPKIHNYKDYERYRNKILSPDDVSRYGFWENIDKYLLGLIDPNLISSEEMHKIKANKLTINHDTLEYLAIVCRLVGQNNIPDWIKNKEKQWLTTNIIELIKDEQVINQKYSFFYLFKSFLKYQVGMLKTMLSYSNYTSAPNLRTFLLDLLVLNNLISFTELIKLLTSLKEDEYLYWFIRKLASNKLPLRYTKEEIVPFIGDYYYGTSVLKRGSNNSFEIRLLATNLIENRGNANDIIEYFFKMYKNPSILNYMRLYKMLDRKWGLYTINSKLLPLEVNQKIKQLIINASLSKFYLNHSVFMLHTIQNDIDLDLKKEILEELITIADNGHDVGHDTSIRAITLLLYANEPIFNERLLLAMKQGSITPSKFIIIHGALSMNIFQSSILDLDYTTLLAIYAEGLKDEDYRIHILERAGLTNSILTQKVFKLIEDYSDLTGASIIFFTNNKVKESIPFLMKLLNNGKYENLIINALFYLDYDLYLQTLPNTNIKSSRKKLKELLPKITTLSEIDQIICIRNAYYIGDHDLFDLIKSINSNNLDRYSYASTELEVAKIQFEYKMSLLERREKERASV